MKMSSGKRNNSANAPATPASLLPIVTVLSNVVIDPQMPAATCTRAGISCQNGVPNDVGVLQVPYQGHHQSIPSTGLTPTNVNSFPMVHVADDNFGDLPDEVLLLLDNLGDNVTANKDMATSSSNAKTLNECIEAGAAISNLSCGVKSGESLPDLYQFHMPARITPLSDDDDMDDFLAPPAKKSKSTSHSKNQKSSQSVGGSTKRKSSEPKRKGVAVEAKPSTSRSTKVKEAPKDTTTNSVLREILQRPQNITSDKKKSKSAGSKGKNVPRKSDAKCSVGGTATTLVSNTASLQLPACSAAALPTSRMGLGIAEKRIQVQDRNHHDSGSDSESEFQIFSQDQYNSAFKTFRRGVSELKKRREAAAVVKQASQEKVRLAEEELQNLRKRMKELEKTLRRERKKIKESDAVMDTTDGKLNTMMQKLMGM